MKIKTTASLLLASSLLIVSPVAVLGYGETPIDWTQAPGCSNVMPLKPWLYGATNAGAGAVNLYWTEVSNSTSWTVAYGVKSGVYPYGIQGFGDSGSRSVKIGGLPSGTYYFALRANNGCMPGPFSTELVYKVGGGAAVNSTGLGTVKLSNVVKPQSSTPVVKQTTPQGQTGFAQNNKVTPTQAPQNVAQKPAAPKAAAPAQPDFFKTILNFFTNLFK